MIPREDLLKKVKIASPCPASWDEMEGDDQKRFCWDCKLNVYNLSDMDRSEAEAFLRQATGRVCVRYYQRQDGTVLTRDCPVGVSMVRRARRRLALAASAAFALFTTGMGMSLRAGQRASYDDMWRARQPEPVRRVLNAIDPPEPAPMLGAMPAPPTTVMGKPAAPAIMDEVAVQPSPAEQTEPFAQMGRMIVPAEPTGRE